MHASTYSLVDRCVNFFATASALLHSLFFVKIVQYNFFFFNLIASPQKYIYIIYIITSPRIYMKQTEGHYDAG